MANVLIHHGLAIKNPKQSSIPMLLIFSGFCSIKLNFVSFIRQIQFYMLLHIINLNCSNAIPLLN
ncbi:MAG TPA: hypothetical protein DG754_14275 [Bacteroidales bacterium]|nr:hypothetical protein [Bacteroidales bacterium]